MGKKNSGHCEVQTPEALISKKQPSKRNRNTGGFGRKNVKGTAGTTKLKVSSERKLEESRTTGLQCTKVGN